MKDHEWPRMLKPPSRHLATSLPRLTKKPDLTDIFDFTNPWGRKSAGNHFLSTNLHEFTQITSFIIRSISLIRWKK